MRYIKIFILAMSIANHSYSQMVGGNGSLQRIPGEVKASELSKGAYTSDVSLFTGAMSASYDLGTVKTLGGLSFNLKLNYTGSKVVGTNLPISTGIPYGEGWSLGIPMVNITVEAFRNYTKSEVNYATNNTDSVKQLSVAKASIEGILNYMAPTVIIPGRINERFIFKTYDTLTRTAIFVPNKFDKYCEMHLSDSRVKVIMNNGDIYYFYGAIVGYQNPGNLKHNGDSLRHNNVVMANNILPKEEIVQFLCTTIENKNVPHNQQISFDYEFFGAFNFFQEYNQPALNRSIAKNTTGGLGLYSYSVAKDYILKAVYAGSSEFFDMEKIELNYKTFNPGTGNHKNLLIQGTSGVQAKDSLYSWKTVYSTGITDTTEQRVIKSVNSSSGNFSNWRRYMHVYSNSSNASAVRGGSILGSAMNGAFSNAHNPYIFNKSHLGCNSGYHHESATGSGDIEFDHGFLESPASAISMSDIIPGELYEFRSLIYNNNIGAAVSHSLCNYDINIVANIGSESGPCTGSNDVDENDFIPGANNSRGFKIFSTFSNPVKWSSFGKLNPSGSITAATKRTETFNIFIMPRLPKNANGIYMQVGPANSDHEFNLNLGVNTWAGTSNNSFYAYQTSAKAYSGSSAYDKLIKNPYSMPPQNFGIGLPWYMMTKIYGQAYSTFNLGTASSGFFNFWFKDNVNSGSQTWSNVPTAADAQVKLGAVELIRYSKNPFMLTSVKKKIKNGYDTDTLQGWVTTSQLDFAYENRVDTLWSNQIETYNANFTFTNDSVINCTTHVANSTISKPYFKNFKKDGYQNVVLLKSIKQIPTNPSKWNKPSTYTYADQPTTHFDYAWIKNDSAFMFRSEINATGNFHPLNKITDQLGGVMQYEYYDIANKDRSSWDNMYIDNDRPGTMYDPYKMGRAVCYRVVPQVKKKIYTNSASASPNQKVWEYDYQNNNCSSVFFLPKTPNPGSYYVHTVQESEIGFQKAIVKHPKLNATDNLVPYDVYTHYTTENNYLTFGKLKSIESYDAKGRLLKKQQFDYKTRMAYMNGVYTGFITLNLDNYNTPPYTDWDPRVTLSTPNPNIFSNEKASINFLGGSIKLIEQDYPLKFTHTLCGIPNYLHSYFVGLAKETTTNYDWPPPNKTANILASALITAPVYSTSLPFSSSARPAVVPLSAFATSSGYSSLKTIGPVISPTLSILPISISTVTDYDYWDCDSIGITRSNGFKELLNDGSATTIDTLNYEPSWELYKTKTYSPEQPGSYIQKEHFYYYDLMQNVWDYIFNPNKFDALKLTRKYSIRNLSYETRTTTQQNNLAPVVRSDYFWYDAAFEGDTVVNSKMIYIDDTTLCNPTSTTVPTSTVEGCALDGCREIRGYEIGNYPLSNWYINWDTCNNTIRILACPIPDSYSNERPPVLWGQMKGKYLFLRKTYFQLDTIFNKNINFNACNEWTAQFPSDELISYWFSGGSYDTIYSGKHRIMRFRQYAHNSSTQIYYPLFPYEVVRSNYIYKYNSLGLLEHIVDVRSLHTYFNYNKPENVEVWDVACSPPKGISSYLTYKHNFGLPNWSSHDYDNKDSLRIYYEYNPDMSVDSIKQYYHPGTAWQFTQHYTYDNFGRLSATTRCGDTLSLNKYNQWDNNFSSTFEQRADKNYVESIIFNDKNSSIAERSRAYVDPLGRKYDVQTQITPNLYNASSYDTIMIHSGLTTYDNWDRANKQYKPFVYRNATPNTAVSFAPRFGSGSDPFSENAYEDNQRSNVLKSSKFGETLSGNTVNNTYNILDGSALYIELNNSSSAMLKITGSSSSAVWKTHRFTKTSSIDEDGKKTVSYSNANGQKVAIKTYASAFASQITVYNYERHSQLGEVINPNNQNTLFRYNFLSQLVKHYSPDADTSYYTYQPWGDKVTSQTAAQKAVSSTSLTNYYYDNRGRVYTSGSELAKYIVYDTAVTSAYFAAPLSTYITANPYKSVKGQKNLAYRVSAEAAVYKGNIQKSVYSYNKDGQIERELIQAKLAASSNYYSSIIEYSYNLRNSVKTQSIDVDANGTFDKIISYTYDGFNRLKTVNVNSDLLAKYDYYDALGLVKKVQYYAGCPNPSDSIEYTYDQRNRLLKINSGAYSEDLYYGSNHPQLSDTSFFVASDFNYNGNINAVKHQLKFAGIYNAVSLTGIMDSATIYGYKYDGMNRLTDGDASIENVLNSPGIYTIKRQYGDERYTYDNIGNFNTFKRGIYYNPGIGSPANWYQNYTYSYISGKNRLNFIDSAGTSVRLFNYNSSGALNGLGTYGNNTAKGVYLEEGNLAKYTVDASDTLFSFYNAKNDRVFKYMKTASVPSRYHIYTLRDYSGKEVAYRDDTDTNWVYSYYGKDLIARQRINNTEYFIHDHLGSERLAYNLNVSHCGYTYDIRRATDYYPYGRVLRRYVGGNTDVEHGYQGSENNNEIGPNDYYTHFRTLNTNVARWEQVDPKAGEQLNFSPYVSMNANPVLYSDPNGDIVHAADWKTRWFLIKEFMTNSSSRQVLWSQMWDRKNMTVISKTTGAPTNIAAIKQHYRYSLNENSNVTFNQAATGGQNWRTNTSSNPQQDLYEQSFNTNKSERIIKIGAGHNDKSGDEDWGTNATTVTSKHSYQSGIINIDFGPNPDDLVGDRLSVYTIQGGVRTPLGDGVYNITPGADGLGTSISIPFNFGTEREHIHFKVSNNDEFQSSKPGAFHLDAKINGF